MSYIVGVDIGGTNTDAVVMCNGKVVSSTKQSTTKDVTTGIIQSIQTALSAKEIKNNQVKYVMIGTTHFVNAVVQRAPGLRRVAVLRLCGSASTALPPFSDFPSDLYDIIYGHQFMLSGGIEFDGSEVTPIVREEIEAACVVLKEKGLIDIAVCGIFSSLNSEQERQVADIISKNIPNARITMSYEVGFTGLLQRENAAILNASIRELAETTIEGMRKALSGVGIQAPFYLTQNDGTLIDSSTVEKFPVRTFASGVTNSMRGAAYLSGYKDAIIVDIGGTSADFGALKGGFPRPASATVEVGEVRTNFPMPNVFSIGLGGGSIVDLENELVGPVSVGYELLNKGTVFGGNVLTATVAAYGYQMGDTSRVANIDKDKLAKIIKVMEKKVERGIEAIHSGTENLPVLLVGGGSILLPEETKIGNWKLIKPKFFGVANAVGAAIAQVSFAVDQIINYTTSGDRDSKIEQLKKTAIEGVVGRGGLASSATITEVEQNAVPYVPGNVLRVRVNAVADLNDFNEIEVSEEVETKLVVSKPVQQQQVESNHTQVESNPKPTPSVSEIKNIIASPKIDGEDWILSEQDIDFISIGTSILGAGGGGSPYSASIVAKRLIKAGKPIRVIPASKIKKGEMVIPFAKVGAPTVLDEKLSNENQILSTISAMENLVHKKASAILIAEIGGCNGVEPLVAAGSLGLPIIDGDLMGRAFPEVQMMCNFIYGLPCFPCAASDEKGNSVVLSKVQNLMWLEKLLRTNCVAMGCEIAVSFPPIDGEDLQRVVVPFSISKAWQLGRAVHESKKMKQLPINSIIQQENGRHLLSGKIVKLSRSTVGGFNRGEITVQGLDEFENQTKGIIFQNENLIAKRVFSDGTPEEVLAVCPDIISIVDSETGINIHTEQLRFGLRVAVLALPIHPLLGSAEAMKVVGPEFFGFKIQIYITYTPMSAYKATVPNYQLFRDVRSD